MSHETAILTSDKLAAITDNYMKERLSQVKPFTAVILKKGPAYNTTDAPGIIWEHGRRNFLLREEGLLPVVCPVNDGTEISGFGIFVLDEEATKLIMNEDPAVKAGVLIYEVHPTVSFPGSSLP